MAALSSAALIVQTRQDHAAAQAARLAMNFYIGSGEGVGAIDLCARALAIVLPRYLDDCAIVSSQMPGAGGITALNFIENVAPADASAWAFPPRSVVLAPLLFPAQARFDPLKLNWIGSPTASPTVGFIRSDLTTARSLDDARRQEIIVGATSPNQDNHFLPRALNMFCGARFKVVGGYRSPSEIELALERGEIQGLIGTSWAAIQTGRAASWLREGKITLMSQFGKKRHAALPSVPTYEEQLNPDKASAAVIDYLLSASAMGYPAVIGSRAPRETVDEFRKAFASAIRDEQFLSLTSIIGAERTPLGHQELEEIVSGIYATPAEIRGLANTLLM